MKNTNFKQNSFETIKCDSPSHSSVYCNDQASSLRSLPGLKHDSMLSEPAGWRNPHLTSGGDVSRPSLSKARYVDGLEYHRVRSLRDLNPAFTITRHLRSRTPKCLRHVGVPRLTSGCDGRLRDLTQKCLRHNGAPRLTGGFDGQLRDLAKKCLRHNGAPRLKNGCDGQLRDLTPMCLRHNGAPRLKNGCDTSRCYGKVVEISGMQIRCGTVHGEQSEEKRAECEVSHLSGKMGKMNEIKVIIKEKIKGKMKKLVNKFNNNFAVMKKL
ncbi:MAG: hypothetical protein ACI4SO_07135, partial [Muribaculaceae bacterium]